MNDDMNEKPNGLSRRSFLVTSGMLGLSLNPILNPLNKLLLNDGPVETTEIEFFRPGDLLRVRFILKNIKPDNNGSFIKADNSQPAYVIVELPPQHVAEEFIESGNFSKNKDIVVKAFAAKNSYLVFTVNQNKFPVDKLLDWTVTNKSMTLQPLVGSADQYDLITEASSNSSSIRSLIYNSINKIPYTTIEAPAGIFLSPLKTADKTHISFRTNDIKVDIHNPDKEQAISFDADARLTYNIELWNNDMLSDDPALPIPNLRLITTTIDLNRDQVTLPTKHDKDILKNHFRVDYKDLNPHIETSLLRFGSLGMSAVFDYNAPTENNDIVKWHHRMNDGRDNYVEVHHQGYIYPLGIRISLASVTERVIEDGTSYLKHWIYIPPIDKSLVIHSDEELKSNSYVFNEPSDTITLEDQLGKIKRNIFFKEVRIQAKKTPPLKGVSPNEIIGGKVNEMPAAFWPVIESTNEKLKFTFTCIDWNDQPILFEMPFIFVSGEVIKRMQKEESKLRKEKKLRDELQRANQALFRQSNGDLSVLRQSVVDAHTNYLAYVDSVDYKENNIQDILKFDSELSNSYRNSPLKDRQIQLTNQKVVYHIGYDSQGKIIEHDIAKLETEFVEFTATSLYDFFSLRQQAVEEKLQPFQNSNQAFLPQLAVASVKLPVIKELAKYDANVLINYADSFLQAGAKFTNDHPNREQILFAIQQASATVLTKFTGLSDNTLTQVRKQLENLKNAATEQIIDRAKDLQTNTQNSVLAWLKQAQTSKEHVITNLFKEAGASLGGAIDPSVAIAYVSLLKDAHYTLRNKVDKYSGQIIPTLNKDRKTFINDAKQQGSQIIAELLGEIKVFGLSLVDYIKSEIPIDSLPKPTINRGNGQTTITYNWNISHKDLNINPNDDGIFRARGKHEKNSAGPGEGNFILSLNLQTVINDSGNSHTISSIALKNFGINMLDLVALYFGHVTLRTEIDASIGRSVRTNTQTGLVISDVAFGSFLSLVQKLQTILGQSNFIFDISPQGILISQGLRLPPISTGPFTMSNIALYTGLRLNFNSAPSLRFAFGEKLNPFTLAVGIFGGRGYLGLDVGTREGKPHIRQLDGALEFGGYVGIDLGIAKGEAYLMAGIFFMKRDDGLSVVEAYITCGGALSVLGILTVSVCFRLGMSYQNGALYGRASLQVRVKLLFFSASYTLTFEKRISGSDSNFTAFLPSYDTDNQLWAYAGRETNSNASLYSSPIKDDVQLLIPYCMIDQRKSTKDSLSELVPVYDPTLIHGHVINDDDLNQYCNFFGL